MRLKVIETVIRGKGTIKTVKGRVVTDKNGMPVYKYNIIGYKIQDLDSEIEDFLVRKEHAGIKILKCLNSELLKHQSSQEHTPELDDELFRSMKYEIENALVSYRGETAYLKAKTCVIKSLEDKSLLVNCLDNEGNFKEEYLSIKPVRQASTRGSNDGSKPSALKKEEDAKKEREFADAVRRKTVIDLCQ